MYKIIEKKKIEIVYNFIYTLRISHINSTQLVIITLQSHT